MTTTALPPTLDRISIEVCSVCSAKPSWLRSRARFPQYNLPRHLAIYIALWVGYNPQIIAEYFNRKRPTVYDSARLIEKMLKTNIEIKNTVEMLQNSLYVNVY
ncbi:MAG: hypothetical protein ACRCZB_03320 [Bacteroidales bacterium]